MCAVQISQAKGAFEVVEREVPEPKPGQVRIKIQPCGICHGDSVKKEYFPEFDIPDANDEWKGTISRCSFDRKLIHNYSVRQHYCM
jgi:hypothetical protein